MNDVPDYFDQYENFVLDRSAAGVLTVRFTPTARSIPLRARPTTTFLGWSKTSRTTGTTRCSC